jgi:hypothetical protein
MAHRLRAEVARRAQDRCEYCLAAEASSPDEFEVDHIQPRKRGGADEIWNLALACRSCNKFKSLATHAMDPEMRMIVPLFHPRRHEWDEHFRMDIEVMEIVGRGPSGRATAVRLRMDRPKAVQARIIWLAYQAMMRVPDRVLGAPPGSARIAAHLKILPNS